MRRHSLSPVTWGDSRPPCELTPSSAALVRSTTRFGEIRRRSFLRRRSMATPTRLHSLMSPTGAVGSRLCTTTPMRRMRLKVLESGAERWTEELHRSTGDLSSWTGHIEALAGEDAFRRATPILVQAVLPSDGWVDSVGLDRVAVMLALTYAIAQDPTPGTSGLEALGDLAEVLVPTGLGTAEYEALVARSEVVFRRLSSPPRLARWVVDLVRVLLHEAAPADDARDGAARRLVALLLPDANRTRPLVKGEVWTELAELLEGRAGVSDAIPALRTAADANTAEGAFSELEGKSILLHTLVQSAAERAREYLEAQTKVRVWTDSSHVGSDRLRDLASRADVVVVASKAAKHSAYETIRPAAGNRLHYASGKGWSSLVTAVAEALSGST